MARIDYRSKEALAWLRFVLNPETTMPVVTDWAAVLAFADKQKLAGICMPFQCSEKLDKKLGLQWYGWCQLTEHRNRLLNQRVGELFGMLEDAGFSCCLLKGQGNAALYPNPLMRCPGDIDVWIDAGEEEILQYVKSRYPDEKESFKHIHFPVFKDTSVDVHTVPLKLYCPTYAKRLRAWTERNKEEQFGHKIKLADVEQEVSVPTGRFNAIYQLGHMLIHLFDEGVGLRQVVDYFYILKYLDITEEERLALVETLRSLGMLRFTRAVMWIECDVLGMPCERCFVRPDEWLGRQLLRDILEGGNFGHYSQRYKGRSGFYQRRFVKAWRVMSLLPLAPREGMVHVFGKIGMALRLFFR